MSKKSKQNKKSKTNTAAAKTPEPVVVTPEPVVIPEKKKRGRKATVLYINYVDNEGNLLPIGRPNRETIRTRLAVMLRKDQPYDKETHFSLAIRLPEDDVKFAAMGQKKVISDNLSNPTPANPEPETENYKDSPVRDTELVAA